MASATSPFAVSKTAVSLFSTASSYCSNCPMTFGSGIKTKNLEAMSLGLPVVTTSIGAENIDAVDGRDWHILQGGRWRLRCFRFHS